MGEDKSSFDHTEEEWQGYAELICMTFIGIGVAIAFLKIYFHF